MIADDPGADKIIMAGLIIKELKLHIKYRNRELRMNLIDTNRFHLDFDNAYQYAVVEKYNLQILMGA